MLAHADEVINIDALLDLTAAVCKLAAKDYADGPDAVGQRHFDSAERFLEQLGVLDRVPPPALAGPRQLDLFDERRGPYEHTTTPQAPPG